MALTEKRKRFADEYIVDLNATRAYMVAYKNVKKEETAAAAASRLLKDVKVKSYIDDLIEQMRSEKIADAREVMEYLTSVLRGKSCSEIVVVEGLGEGISEARKLSKNPDERERLKAAELLGKRYGLFTDKTQIEGAQVVIVDDIPK